MLITFRVANFLSFNEEEEFSMLAGKQRKPVRPAVPLATGVEALKLAVVYGANASGKSNLVRSIDFAKKMIVDGVKYTSKRTLNDHFRLKKGSENEFTKFEFEFSIKSKIYAYGFQVYLDKGEILEEWLFEIKKTTQKPIFERIVRASTTTYMKSKPSLKGQEETRFNIYAQDVQANELLLNELGEKLWDNESFFSIFRNIHQWFKNGLFVIYPDSQSDIHNFFESSPTELENVVFTGAMLKNLGTGISEIKIQEEDYQGKDTVIEEMINTQKQAIKEGLGRFMTFNLIIDNKRYLFARNGNGKIITYRILTKHDATKDANDVFFDYQDESDGTKRLLDFIPFLKFLSVSGVTVVIDEIDRSLHPELLHKIIEFYLDSSSETNSQLIVTTHESSLLDLSLLRRDEIWFVEKNNHGESHLYSLEEFQPRFDKEIRKAYLQGRYGAIPFISDVQQLNWETANAEG